MGISNNLVSRVLGYNLRTGNFNTTTENLPQRLAILGEANEANQATLDITPRQILSAKEAGDRYGYGSPLYNMIRILLPIFGGGVSGIPVMVYPQAKAVGSAARVLDVTPTGTATAPGTHTLIINGRRNLDGIPFDVNISIGDTPTIIVQKAIDVVNNILGSTVIGTNTTPTVARFSAKWNGLTSQEVNITVDTNGLSLGVTWAVVQFTAGSGTPAINTALAAFGSEWNTIVVNGYGAVSSILDALEQFNGKPDPITPTGRYSGIIFKPFVAIYGSTLADPTSITHPRLNELTNALAPAPNSTGLSMEAAANMAVEFANISQNAPHLDVAGKTYKDMPTPTNIGVMADYATRNAFVEKGCSTVDLVNGQYVIQDFVTTYHKVGETPPQFRYPRILMIDFNVKFGWYLIEQENVVDHAIAADDDIVSAVDTIKPKQMVQLLNTYADDLANRALITMPEFMKASISVNLSTVNPDRFQTYFRYKRSGFARISDTDAEAGFNFGTLN